MVAAAGGRTLRVFVPADADPVVLGRLEQLGAHIEVCDRDGSPGDPTYRRLLQRIDEGAVPFTCQGNLNGLAVEGGETLGWEIVSSGTVVDRLVVQVGGGALASACIHAFGEGVELGALAATPRIDTVQTEGAWPLKRALDAVGKRGDAEHALRFASHHRSAFMWPWESEPRSVAHGILDDETYDWLAVVEGMLATEGRAARRRRGDARGGQRACPRDDRTSTSITRAPPVWPACSRCKRWARLPTTSASPCSSPES